jgi:hypothetical protein
MHARISVRESTPTLSPHAHLAQQQAPAQLNSRLYPLPSLDRGSRRAASDARTLPAPCSGRTSRAHGARAAHLACTTPAPHILRAQRPCCLSPLRVRCARRTLHLARRRPPRPARRARPRRTSHALSVPTRPRRPYARHLSQRPLTSQHPPRPALPLRVAFAPPLRPRARASLGVPCAPRWCPCCTSRTTPGPLHLSLRASCGPRRRVSPACTGHDPPPLPLALSFRVQRCSAPAAAVSCCAVTSPPAAIAPRAHAPPQHRVCTDGSRPLG